MNISIITRNLRKFKCHTLILKFSYIIIVILNNIIMDIIIIKHRRFILYNYCSFTVIIYDVLRPDCYVLYCYVNYIL